MDMSVDLVHQTPQYIVQAAPAAKHVVHHAVHHIAPVIKQGFTMLQVLISTVVSLAIGFGAGWYVKGRGLTGVKTDATNAITTTENVVTAVKAAA